MLFKNQIEGQGSKIASLNSAAVDFWVEEKIELAKGLHLLTKASQTEKRTAWTLRFALLAGLATASYYLIRTAMAESGKYNQELGSVLSSEQANQQNQTNLLSQYVNTKFIKGLTCNDPAVFSITSGLNCYANKTTSYLNSSLCSYRDLTLNSYRCSISVAEVNNQSLTLNTLCRTDAWQFAIPNDTHHHRLNAIFNKTCCPILYGICDELLKFPALPGYSERQIVGPAFGAGLTLVAILLELINAFLTESRKSLSSPRFLFFPLKLQFCFLSSKDLEQIRVIASKYKIKIVEKDVNATLLNFKAAFNKRIIPDNPDDIVLSPLSPLQL